MQKQVVVAVLAGGGSVRMGTDKAMVEFEGETLLARITGAAMAAGLPVWIIGRSADDTGIAEMEDVVAIPDEAPGLGPLGGLATALRRAADTIEVLLVPCDLPLITPAAFQWLASLAKSEKTAAADGIVAAWRGNPEPLFAVYRRSLLPMIDRHIAMRRLSMVDLIKTGAFVQVPLPVEHATAVKDADTPDELKDLMRGF